MNIKKTQEYTSKLQNFVALAIAEDLGSGDITAALIPEKTYARAQIISRMDAVFCGKQWATEVFRQIDPAVKLDWRVADGDQIKIDQCLVTIQGKARSILTAERTALNFIQTLAGTATKTRLLVNLVAHTKVKLLDTRKTIPGLRVAQKYAVTVGGGQNHRIGLFDAYLIKENHIRACGGIKAAVSTARMNNPGRSVEVEVQNLAELELALAASADTIMLDNFSQQLMIEAVAINKGKCKLEASGNIDDESLVKTAETGVDFISIGALTKHCFAVDLSLLFDDPT
ncbi:MAG: nicotinate-nucleotide pyrophosphorylase (carboxylating) [Pseudohongiellaceae bacterium]|jgi:nicotinate-nucleotide pyrophosphorylase (carboxylating)